MSVAIRTATRIVDQDDFGSTPGAGNDGYALVWDNGAGAFVLAAAGVTDHGALTGLSDDDHTGYALLAGRSGGQTFYGGTDANDDITIHGTSNATRTTSYVILQPTAGNVGIGTATPGSKLDVSGTAHFLVGTGRGIAFETPAVGYGTSFVVYGGSDWYGLASVVLANARDLSVTATKSWAVVYRNASDMLRFQYNSATDASGTQLCPMLIDKTGKVSIGNWTSATADAFTPSASLHVLTTDIATTIVTNVATLGHNTSGTAAAGFGGGLVFNLQSSTTASQSAGLITSSWIVATHASRTARLALSAYDYGGAREGIRIDTNGSAALLGFYGHAAVAQQVLATGAGASVDNVISALQALGLVKQS